MYNYKILYFAPGNASTAAGYWGDYNCDVPYHTQENLMQFVAGMKDNVCVYRLIGGCLIPRPHSGDCGLEI